MPGKLDTPSLGSIPPYPRHAITVHMPGWAPLLRFVARDPALMTSFKSMYPRMMIHKDIQDFSKVILEKYGAEGQNILLFPTPTSAEECKAYALSPLRKENVFKEEEVSIRVFQTNIRVWGVLFPAPKTQVIMGYWSNAGTGICSRLGEDLLEHVDLLYEVTDDSPAPEVPSSPVHRILKERIAGLLERSPLDPSRKAKVSPDDVYLYPTGMASIYGVHQALLKHFNGGSVLFGFAFHSTIHVFEDFEGPPFKFFGNGTPSDTDLLAEYLEAETQAGRKVQAVWAEFPSNPILTTPDLTHLRQLADKYDFVLIIDDTISSFSNVDLFGAADIIVTSLTKSFSGYADVMGASAVLNPSSKKYAELKPLLTSSYENTYYIRDAEVLEKNSRNYLERSKILNDNAQAVVDYLQSKATDPSSAVTKVFYPTTLPSKSFYDEYIRPATPEFTPGYGCLFSLELDSTDTMRAFYENLNVHIGPHLGAHLTLALPYVKSLYIGPGQLDEVGEYGLKELQIRVSVGLEPTEELVEVFREAVDAADKVKKEGAGEA